MNKAGIEVAPAASGDASIAHAALAGRLKITIFILALVGSLLLILSLGILACIIWKPEMTDSYFNRVIPIIAGAIAGLTGFVVGQKWGDR